MSLSDNALLEQFEAKLLLPTELNHLSHLRIAWLYLLRLELSEVIEKICTGTKEYVENLGEFEKFHRTVTEATARIMGSRMSRRKSVNFEEFLHHNRDLVDDLRSLIGQHYSSNIIESNYSKKHFILPGKRKIA